MSVTSVEKDPESLTMTVTADLDATVERAWQLWADPRQFEQWWGPPDYPTTVVDHDLRPGGRIMVLEFMRPVAPPVVAMMAIFQRLSGHVGRWISGQEAAYRYLPASIGGFWSAAEFETLLRERGLRDVRYFHFSGGIATTFVGQKPRNANGS